jgi:hypothetical protein
LIYFAISYQGERQDSGLESPGKLS